MSVAAERNIWIPSRVPKSLQCSECNRICNYVAYHQPEQYEYRCGTCGATKMLTLSQINAMESNRLRRVPVALPPVISDIRANFKR
ncbi:hypothetical protein [Candidatus Korobacter versatilis]|nr:hypothetical protein [Candidatus Koribacter versatilis]